MKRFISTIVLATVLVLGCSKEDASAEDNNQNSAPNKNLNRQATGSSANDLLSDSTFKSMVIELVYVEGFEPSQTAVDNFISFLTNRTFKPNGITVEKRSIPSPGKDSFTIEEIADIEREARTKYNTDTEIAVWALFIDGKSANDSENSVTLGSAYWNTSFVIYQETVQNLSNSPLEPNRSVLETTVINHELGHILGLTDLGSDMQEDHEDAEHPKHCNVEECLMYWSAETGAGIANMAGMNSAPQLDAFCLADLKANGGK